MPPTSDELHRYTLDELLVDFFCDSYKRSPKALVEDATDEELEQVGGDPIVARWERQIARGEEVDLFEGLTKKQVDAVTHRMAKVRAATEAPDLPEGTTSLLRHRGTGG